MFIDEALVVKVTNEIVRRITAGAAVPQAAAARGVLLLAGPTGSLTPACLDQLSKSRDIRQLSGLDAASWPKAPLLVTRLGLQALVQVASGDEGCTTEGRALLHALLEGRPALALKSGIAWRSLPPAAPRVFLTIYQTAETTLKNAGLKIVDEGEIAAALAAGQNPFVQTGPAQSFNSCAHGVPVPPSGPAKSGKVYAESSVAAMFPAGSAGSLTLRPGDILTPLARDYLTANKIPVDRQS
ncbi:MAG: hypothetical protein LBO05_09690 [Deltaproteobacteria bacterium]|nr:hypothetical protein [Deltaproteobacteria bacterium]